MKSETYTVTNQNCLRSLNRLKVFFFFNERKLKVLYLSTKVERVELCRKEFLIFFFNL